MEIAHSIENSSLARHQDSITMSVAKDCPVMVQPAGWIDGRRAVEAILELLGQWNARYTEAPFIALITPWIISKTNMVL